MCIALGVLVCCVGSAEAEKQQLHNDTGVVSVHTALVLKQPLMGFILRQLQRQTM